MHFLREEDGIYYRDENGKEMAKITFSYISDDIISIEHTIVDESLRGQGIAKKLVDALAELIREKHLKAKAVCPYVVSLFAKDTSYDDIKI